VIPGLLAFPFLGALIVLGYFDFPIWIAPIFALVGTVIYWLVNRKAMIAGDFGEGSGEMSKAKALAIVFVVQLITAIIFYAIGLFVQKGLN